jgi:hypothetical protein
MSSSTRIGISANRADGGARTEGGVRTEIGSPSETVETVTGGKVRTDDGAEPGDEARTEDGADDE